MEVALPDSSPTGTERRSSLDEAMRAASWCVLVGVASGAIAGFLVGGVGGRLAMLLLRLTSPPEAIGLISDDGFEIGVITTSSLTFAIQMTFLGGINGVLYTVARTAIPAGLRLPLWTAFGALTGGATVVHDDGVDFTVLEPALLAILLFVALPGLASALVVVLAERWSKATPWQSRRLAMGLVLAAAASTLAVVAALAVFLVALALGASRPLSRVVQRAGRILVPGVLVVLAVIGGIDLVQESRSILGD